MTSGDNLPHSSGIPYGEGWNLDIPSISMSMDDFRKYTATEKYQIHLRTNSCRNSGSGLCDESEDLWPRYSQSEIQEEGKGYWHSVTINIPGVISERMVYKYSTDKVPFKMIGSRKHVFVPHTFESYTEAWFDGDTWTVIASDGTRYEFNLKQINVKNAPNQRLGKPVINDYSLFGTLLPTKEALSWYCTKIEHPNKPGDIRFKYETFGTFDYFKEFSQPLIDHTFKSKYNNTTVTLPDGSTVNVANFGDFDFWTNTFKDIFIKEISSGFEKLEFDYKSRSFSDGYALVDVNSPDVTRKDSLYASEVVYSAGSETGLGFNNWNRYRNLKSGIGNQCAPYTSGNNVISTAPSNPYKGRPFTSGSYAGENFYWQEPTNGNTLEFDHSFLESPRITSGATLFPAGDIYEIRTQLFDQSGYGNIDLNIVSGDWAPGSNNTMPTTVPACNGANYVNAKYLEAQRGESIFSTFNQAIKWNPFYANYPNSGAAARMTTSNYFMMPNLPDDFQGFNIQIGPGNSDIDFNTNETVFCNNISPITPITCLTPSLAWAYTQNFGPLEAGGFNKLYPNIHLWPGENMPQNFGMGANWYMTMPWMAEFDPIFAYYNDESVAGNSIWFNNQTHTGIYPQPGWNNVPTYSDQSTVLEKVELVRHTKVPYMLNTATKSSFSGDRHNPEGSWHITNQLKMDYEVRKLAIHLTLYEENPDCPGLYTITDDVAPQDISGHTRNVFLLTAIRQLARTNPTPYIKADLPTTHFGYDDQPYVELMGSAYASYLEGQIDPDAELMRSTNFALLTKIVSPTGRETEISYKDLNAGSYSIVKSFSRPEVLPCTGGQIQPQSFFANIRKNPNSITYQEYFIVDQKKVKEDNNQERIWDYIFNDLKRKGTGIPLTDNFKRNRSSVSAGFSNVTVYEPELTGGIRPYSKYYHSTDGPNTDPLLWGKLYKTEAYDHAGTLISTSDITFETIKAFENGAFRAIHNSGVLNSDYEEYSTTVNNSGDYLTEDRNGSKFYEVIYADHIQQHNPTFLHSYFIKKTEEKSKTYDDNGNGGTDAIEQITEFEYWDADHTGKSASEAWSTLFPLKDFTPTGSDRLNWEPSWQLYSSNTYSPQYPDAHSKQEYFYYFDLLNDDLLQTAFKYGLVGDDANFVATQRSWDYRLRPIAYESKTSNKAPGQPEISTSEYYLYDHVWNGVDIWEEHEVLLDPGTVCNSPYAEDVLNCGTPHGGNVSDPPYGWCIEEDGNTVLWCRCEPQKELDNGRFIQGIPTDDFLQFRALVSKTDESIRSVYANNAVSQHYQSNPILRFEKTMNSNGDYEFLPLYPHETLESYTVLERNAYGNVQLEQDAKGLKTRYKYSKIYNIKTQICDPAWPNGVGWGIHQYYENIAVPLSITVGAGLPDSLQTFYNYNPDYTVASVTNPNGMVLSFDYDNFGRMASTYQNGDKLNEVNYHQWANDESLNFADRTMQNYVQTKTFNTTSGTSYMEAKAFVDPLGRNTLSFGRSTDDLNKMIISGFANYDAWDRPFKAYKPFEHYNSTNIQGGLYNALSVYNPAFSEQLFENNQRSRPLKTAKPGEDILGNHVIENTYRIIGGDELSGLLSLTTQEYNLIAPGSKINYRFSEAVIIDEDDKSVKEYTNAIGQKIATYRQNGAEKIVTLFLYDSQGNLSLVINPEKQESRYGYNLLGQLYKKQTVDGGETSYVYDKTGMLRAEQDANGKANDFFRAYTYDIYGRSKEQAKITINGYALNPFFQFDADKSMAWRNSGVQSSWPNSLTFKEKEWFYHTDFDRSNPSFAANTNNYLYNSLTNSKGQLTHTISYNPKEKPIEYRFMSYNNKGQLKWEMMQYNYNGISNVAKGSLVRIDYPTYNLQGGVVTQNVDLDGDKVLDMQYHFTYDAWNRQKDIFVSYDNQLSNGYKVASYQYDDARGTVKELNYYDSQSGFKNYPVDAISYDYDIRDRLTSISAHLFDWNLFYDNANPLTGYQPTQNWNGNINATRGVYKLNTAINDPGNFDEGTTYAYQYDGLNRLVKANASITNSFSNLQNLTVGDTDYSYDKIGNLNTLHRWINTNNGPQRMLQSYSYGAGNNKLMNIHYELAPSISGSSSGSGIGVTPEDWAYTYDENGNLKTDSKRKIITTVYGRANLPWYVRMQGKAVYYHYDVNDQRIYKNIRSKGSVVSAEYYIRTASGKELAVVDLQKKKVTWYVHGKERLAKFEHTESWEVAGLFAKSTEISTTETVTMQKTQSLEGIKDTNGDLQLPDALHYLLLPDGSTTYHLGSKLADAPTGYTIQETIHLLDENQQLELASNDGETKLVSITEMLKVIEEPDIIIGIHDSFYDAYSLLSNLSVPNFVFYVYDHLGNTRVAFSTALGANGLNDVEYTVESAVDYYPYGKVLREYHHGAMEKYLTTQHERDVETGLDYRGARFYDSDVGRFLSLDPLAADFAEWSDYNYVLGNPILLTDPDGRSPNNGNGPPIELLPQVLIQTVNKGIQHLKYSIWRNWTIATTDKTEEDIPYRTYDTQVNGAGIVEVVYTEHDVEPPLMERLADTGMAGLDMAAGLPSSGPVSLMAKVPGGGGTISEVIVSGKKFMSTEPGMQNTTKINDMTSGLKAARNQAEFNAKMFDNIEFFYPKVLKNPIDGNTYVVNGHHRLIAAQKANTKFDVPVQIVELKETNFKTYQEIIDASNN